jgi:light-regulated signal transduction histidine kinase (bacteriophytochrome)
MASSTTARDQRIAELEGLLEQRTAELNQARKELDALTYSVSHDLRAPLRHIRGYAQILAEGSAPSLGEESRGHLAKVQEGARKMGQMLDELLNLSRLARQPLELEQISLAKVVTEVLRDLARVSLGRKVEWKIGQLPVLECDPGLARQLLHHLLSNALKFTGQGNSALIEVGTLEQNGTVCFVRDNGVGFDMQYADKLFTMFQRLHPQQEFDGLGAGLALAQRIVQSHGGRIWAEAAPGHGATFYFTLNSSSGPQVSVRE